MVTIIGRPVELPLWAGIKFTQQGFLNKTDVSLCLRSSAFGYVVLSPLYLAKSSIFAAFAAHGVVPVIPGAAESLPDGLRRRTHYLCPQSESSSEIWNEEHVSHNMWNWYQDHNVARTTAVYAEDINS